MKDKLIIGRSEIVDFPELNIFGIAAKIDTGAYTSSIHVEDIQLNEVEGQKLLCFKVYTSGNDKKSLKQVCYTDFRQKKIRNSFGGMENRYIINTHIDIFGHSYKLELSLADRAKMKFPVLIGRKLLYRKFIVDVSLKNVSVKSGRKKLKAP